MLGLFNGNVNSIPEPISGLLKKQSRGKSVFGATNWQDRFFTVENGKLSYYNGNNSVPSNKKGEVDLATVKLHEKPEQFSSESKNPSFLIALFQENTGNCELLMEATSSEEAERWKVALQAHISYMALQNELLKKKATQNIGTYGFLDDIFSSEPPRPFEGYLSKRSRGRSLLSFSNWQKRYFILQSGQFTYYEDNKEKDTINLLKGTINLLGVTLHPQPEIFCDDRQSNQLIALCITSTDSCDLLVEAESPALAEQWRNSLTEHIFYLNQLETYKINSSTTLEEYDDEYEDCEEEEIIKLTKKTYQMTKKKYQESKRPLPICFVFSTKKKSGLQKIFFV